LQVIIGAYIIAEMKNERSASEDVAYNAALQEALRCKKVPPDVAYSRLGELKSTATALTLNGHFSVESLEDVIETCDEVAAGLG